MVDDDETVMISPVGRQPVQTVVPDAHRTQYSDVYEVVWMMMARACDEMESRPSLMNVMMVQMPCAWKQWFPPDPPMRSECGVW